MLSLSLVEEIDRLLKDGKLSQRKIAARLGVSRSTVGAIAGGRREKFGKRLESGNPYSLVPLVPPVRCAVCGYLIYMPCLVCRARDYQQRHRQAVGTLRMGDHTLSARPSRRVSAASRGRRCGVRVA